jgi:hypothetical protein
MRNEALSSKRSALLVVDEGESACRDHEDDRFGRKAGVPPAR